MKRLISCVLAVSMVGGLTASAGSESKNFTVSYDVIAVGDVSSGVSVHDPSILEVDGTYYIYGSHMTAAKSTDLLNWESIAD
ncbi:MAG: arabinan endo-1,5-alpha-L-arabinosidase, partial [Pseudobutyrivibrio sp.]|nr:arabinan endo-1,5-alpha-L-arabinosidase [Pseudobutyrivibrio sp.]